MEKAVSALLADAGVPVLRSARNYRPSIDWPALEVKLLKPQNIVEMLQAGTRDLGFAGADWVSEKAADVVELLDTGLNPVRVVAAVPVGLLEDGRLPRMPLRVASEYERLTRAWIDSRELDATFVRTYGATEVFPPEDADCIVDNTATGATLVANGLQVLDELMVSSTRLYASREALEDERKRARIEDLVMLLRSVLEARGRVIVELNVSASQLDAVIDRLPSMGGATVSPLTGDRGFAVKAAVPRRQVALLIPDLKSCGGSDLIVTEISQLVL
ncbi:MAG: ATP phosphoribosyltransferase [Planctomycetota bacterium]|jgi:ATP phosphoribosyltransferase